MCKKVGVVGAGFVGGAVAQGFSLHTDLTIYDKYKEIGSIQDVMKSDFIFVCVPTNTSKEGKQDLSVVEGVIADIKNNINLCDKHPIIIIKSTILPGTCEYLSNKYKLPIVFCPEFLTARNARLDFINPARLVIGSNNIDIANSVESLFRCRFSFTPIYKTTWEAAEMVKYMANCFFALKISYLNEMYDICQAMGIDYNLMKDMWLADGRIGNSHADVPGHDGDRGFGGTCFPKDLKAFIEWAKNRSLKVDTLEAAQDVNERVRKLIDWIEAKDIC